MTDKATPANKGYTCQHALRRKKKIEAMAIEATPTRAAAFLEIREPTSASTIKLANGIAGISHNNLSTLSSHSTGRIGIQRFVLVVQLQQ